MDSGGDDVCPTEDAVAALLQYLVDPKLPSKSSAITTPSHLDQEAVAKQVYAVVLLYDYYHRKRYPHLEFLRLESFCKVAVMSRPCLLGYMKLMQEPNGVRLEDPVKQLSLTENKIMRACDVAAGLHGLVQSPSFEGWPISRVAVLLVDIKKENCFLESGSNVEGVWSMIEKDVLNPCSKRRKTAKRAVETGTDEAGLEQLAFTAVKEVTGIDQSDLTILEKQLTYSLSGEKTTCRFYIIQCNQPSKSDRIQVPIKNAIDSLQGPLFKKSSSEWLHTSVVEYFLLLPYAQILSSWFASINSEYANRLQVERKAQETLHEDSLKGAAEIPRTHGPLVSTNTEEDLGGKKSPGLAKKNDQQSSERHNNGSQVQRNGEESVRKNNLKGAVEFSVIRTPRAQGSWISVNTVEDLGGRGSDGLLKHNDQNAHLNIEKVSNSQKQNRDEHCTVNQPVCAENEGNVAEVARANTNNRKNASSGENYANVSGASIQKKMILRDGSSDIATGSVCGKNNSSEHGGTVKSYHPPLMYSSGSEEADKLCRVLASKDKQLSQLAVEVLLSKRDKLSLLQRNIEDQIAEHDKNIQTILNGGEDGLALKVEALIEGCSDVRTRSIAREKACQDIDYQLMTPCLKRRLEGVELNVKTSCQELDDVCYKNNWILPNYRVSMECGEFRAKVTVKGMDFECSENGELSPQAREARESAAAQMLTKLHSMLN